MLTVLGLVALVGAACGKEEPPKPGHFKVGGTISGLSGSLTLRLNGAESITRSENGPFTFEGVLEDQSTFTVTLTAAPEQQECLLQGATGKLQGADVSTVEVNCSQRTYTVGGTAEGLDVPLQLRLNESETLSLSTSGAFTFQTRLLKGATYNVTLVAQPQARRCTLSNTGGTVAGNVTTLVLQCNAWYTLTDHQSSAWIIGQNAATDSEPNRGGALGQDTLAGPGGNPVLAGGKLYVSDSGANRVLGFNGLPHQSVTPAEFVLGQPDFTSDAIGIGRAGLSFQAGLSSDGTRLAVADKANNRILLYQTLPKATAAPADTVLGQRDFDSTESRCAKNSLNSPDNVVLSHGMLLVADTYNNRVLIWKTVPTTSDVEPDLVLGQTQFTLCAANDKNQDGVMDADRVPTASTLWLPMGIWTDGTRLIVIDSSNCRGLIWNQFPTQNGQAADVVLGQGGFTSNECTTTQSGLNAPSFVYSTGTQLFVADTSNHRIMVWNAIPSTHNAPASNVLGQKDFTSMNEYDPPTGTTPSARSLYRPGGMLFTGPYVVVTDQGNNRLVVYESP
ncbi:hypothetical protein [Hyalangium versicolor]|uniref:hypothetical protein n=1 Tax=Hyalangium versicolor TaxID=2861190 RepID=UPI001CC98343|nr:hypothetical protein [Hyalangium versicolor]